MNLSQRDDGGGKVVERQEGVFQLLVAHQQLAKSVEPPVAGFDYPTTRLLLRITLLAQRFLLAIDHMWDIA